MRDTIPTAQRLVFAACLVLVLLLTMGALLSVGAGSGAVTAARFLFAIGTLGSAGAVATIWLLAAVGWGCLWLREPGRMKHPWIVRLALGVATLIWLAHLLGWAGTGTTATGAGFPLIVGVGLLLVTFRRNLPRLHPAAVSPIAFAAVPGLAVLLVASVSWPGWLWESEAFGYDVLEYHLQLPAEWLRAGALQALTHNAHSYMPNYMEAVFLQLAALRGSMHAASGAPILYAQVLHAALAIVTAAALGATVAGSVNGRGDGRRLVVAGWTAAVWFVLTPWTQVVGSMAYVEMAICLLFLGALVILEEESLSWTRRSFLVGWLGAAAIGAKLTASFVAFLPVLALMAMRAPARAWLPMAAAGAASSSAMLLPYLARNFLATGNPVFPFATGIFGHGHWTEDALVRWQRMLSFDMTLGERVAPIVSELWRAEWSVALWTGAVALVAGMVRVETRRRCLEITIALGLSFVAWALWTQVLARYLIPWLIPLGLVVGLLAGRIEFERGRRAPLWLLAGVAVWGLMVKDSLSNFLTQRGGEPSTFVSPSGYGIRTGAYFLEHLENASEAPVIAHVNYRLDAGSLVYLVGESRVLYVIRRALYTGPWEATPLGRFVREAPNDPESWAKGLRTLGATHLWVNWAELDRLVTARFSDPEVTPERVARFIQDFARPVASTGSSSGLYELAPAVEAAVLTSEIDDRDAHRAPRPVATVTELP